MDTKILLVDDETRILQTFARTLRLGGYTVITAEDGEQGLMLYHQEQPDIVLLDLRMPGMSGLEVLQAIREDDPEANVILCTAHGDKEAVIEALRAGASDFLPKPIDQVTLESALRRAEERIRLKRKLRASQEALRRQNERLEEEVQARTIELRQEIEEHKRTSKDLRESEEKFRTLFNSAGDAIFIHNLEGNFLEVNQEAVHRLGYSRQELLQMSPRDIDAAVYAPLAPERIARVEEEGRAVLETAHVTRDGRIIPIELSCRLIQYGEERAILSIARDVTERKQVEEKLQESEERYKRAERVGHFGSWEMDIATGDCVWSDEFFRICGYEPGELEPSSEIGFQIIHPDDRDRAAQQVNEVLETGTPYNIEKRIVQPDGTVRWVRSIGEVIYDDRGEPAKLVGSFLDITEQKRAEEELQESEERFREIYVESPIGIELYDANGELVDVNDACLKVFGVSDAAAVRGFRLFEDPNLPDEARQKLLQGQTVQYETVFDFEQVKSQGLYETTRSGTIHLDVKATALDARGRRSPDSYMVQVQDITERKRAEEALRESHERLLTILNSIDADIYVADIETHEVLFANQHMRASFGKDLVGEKCWNVFRGRSGPCPHCTNGQLLDAHGHPTGVVAWEGQNPITGRWYINYDRAVSWVDDHLVRLQVATDITERKRVEAALRESEEQLQEYARDLKRMVEQKVRQLEQERANAAQLDRLAVLGEMASNVVHELRDPLTAIGFEADYLVWTAATAKEKHGGDLNATLDAATAGKIGKGLQGDLARCQRLIDHLVNFGRISSEPASYICLNQPIEDSFILIGARLRGCDIDVRLDLADDLPPILANPHRLEQVFINLINNAEHAMEGKASEQPDYRKELEITTAASGDEVIATVRDNGIGIPEDVRARIFDPFFTTKPRGDGMGLGLSTSASIVAEYGGEITFESVEGEGATFMLRFPVAELGKKGAE